MRIESRYERALRSKASQSRPLNLFKSAWSTCVSNDLACCRSCAQPVPADTDILLGSSVL